MGRINRQDNPPRPGPQYPILRVAGSKPTRFVLCSRSLTGLWTHWVADCSMPCEDPREECRHCQAKKPRRWKGYLHAINMANNEEGFLEVTPGGAKQLISQAGEGVSYRGLQIVGSRGNGEKTRQRIEVVYALPSSAGRALPEEKDPMVTLLELWGIKGFRLVAPDTIALDGQELSA